MSHLWIVAKSWERCNCTDINHCPFPTDCKKNLRIYRFLFTYQTNFFFAFQDLLLLDKQISNDLLVAYQYHPVRGMDTCVSRRNAVTGD